MTTKLLIRLNIANIITTRPAVLKKIPDLELLVILNEPKLRRAKTGNVPSAKANIVRPPFQKLPVLRVKSCIDCVKPQGKKNVANPIKTGARV